MTPAKQALIDQCGKILLRQPDSCPKLCPESADIYVYLCSKDLDRAIVAVLRLDDDDLMLCRDPEQGAYEILELIEKEFV